MSSELIECRLCGNFNVPKMKLTDKIKGFLSFKEFIEYFCRIHLDEDAKLPQHVCTDCYALLIKFCLFTVNVEKQNNKFQNRLPLTHDEHPKVTNSSHLLKRKSEEEPVNHNSSHQIMDESERPAKKKAHVEEKAADKSEYNTVAECLHDVNLLFKDEIEAREKQYEKVTIKESLLLDCGEIPRSWLEKYRDFMTWHDFTYQCSVHCNKQMKSLYSLLRHFEDNKVPIHKRAIKCNCGRTFKEQLFLVSYLNHVGKCHYTHLKFTCIFCSKVFVNVVKLSNHVSQNHGKSNIKYFPCFDCGLVCSNLPKLKQHKNCHEI